MKELYAIISAHRKPAPGILGRLRLYFESMHPLPLRFLNAAAFYLSFSIIFCRANYLPVEPGNLYSLLGISNLFLLGMILRLMDELKDLEIDRDLFLERPVPSGKVLVSDIVTALVFTVVLYLIINSFSPATLVLALICLGYTFLMLVYFFMPILLRRYLLLNLATHNPSVALMLLISAAIAMAPHDISLSQLDWSRALPVIIMYWFPILGWELSRKIRPAEEENEYVTYSQIFGRVPSTLITLAVLSVPVAIGIYLEATIPLPAVFIVILLLAYAVVLYGHLRFIFSPSPATSQLKPYTEKYTLLVLLAGIISYLGESILR